MSTIHIKIPEIVLSIDTKEDIEKEEKRYIENLDGKEPEHDFFFVMPYGSIENENEKTYVMTLVDCLTVPAFSFCEICKSNLTEDTLFGFNDVMPRSQIIFGDKELENVKNKIKTDVVKILNDITRFSISKFSTRLSSLTQIDVVSLKQKHAVWSFDLTHGHEIPKCISTSTTSTKCCSRCGNEHNLLDMFIAVGEDASDASLVVCKECSNMYSSKIPVKNALDALN